MGARKSPVERYSTIEEDTPIIVAVVADTAIGEFERLAKCEVPDREAVVKQLVDKANTVYAHNAGWRAKIRGRGNTGRDTLYAYMHHWLGAHLKGAHPDMLAKVPSGYGWSWHPT